MDSYKTIESKLGKLEPFRGNSMRATKAETWGTLVYRVYSYGTLIAEKCWDGTEGEWFTWVYPERISVTTSRHQNLIKKVWAI